ncbi:conserved hypothetical protein [Gloeothece citriformis PCC 7424]|uniref:HepT-like domain-containing protein n=1 Tax=Gloeothece citriformis (strain PCC 7424) TaxID=65393 RepID=B7KIZ1_GLOC7|nr:hypothetical protein [Gloeothece citriformis]ACK70827.1 conserved hypothetical protein [Gloeothece citriformis PCC 7424]
MSNSQLIERIEQEIVALRGIVTQTDLFVQQQQQMEALPYQEALSSAIALNLHSFYTGVERILEMIARTIDYSTPTGDQWYRQLLEQMSIDIPAVRPPVISQSTRTRLDEFRRFRHVVRSIYAYRLETSRVIALANQLGECHQEFEQEVQEFIEFIQKQP